VIATEKGIMGLYGLTISGVCVAGRSFIASANLKTGFRVLGEMGDYSGY
jgi:hypothetical protein